MIRLSRLALPIIVAMVLGLHPATAQEFEDAASFLPDMNEMEEIIDEYQRMTEMPIVKLRSLDKVTARTMTFEANVGATLKFGSLYIKAQSCRRASPLENPESAAFLQIWEVDSKEEASWIFSGWMFASSPGLSSMDHPIYDVWVLGCLEKKAGPTAEEKQEEQEAEERGEGEIDAEEAPSEPSIEGEE